MKCVQCLISLCWRMSKRGVEEEIELVHAYIESIMDPILGSFFLREVCECAILQSIIIIKNSRQSGDSYGKRK